MQVERHCTSVHVLQLQLIIISYYAFLIQVAFFLTASQALLGSTYSQLATDLQLATSSQHPSLILASQLHGISVASATDSYSCWCNNNNAAGYGLLRFHHFLYFAIYIQLASYINEHRISQLDLVVIIIIIINSLLLTS